MLVVLLIGFIGAATPVAAHSGLGAASPAPGSTVGGEITEIQLRYAAAVTDASGSVTGPDGTVLASNFVQTSALAITIELDIALSIPGEYAVRHSTLSVNDSDRVDAAYLFTYDPAAPPPSLEILEPDNGGWPTWMWVVLAGGAALIAVLSWRLIGSIRRGDPRDPPIEVGSSVEPDHRET